MYHAEAIAARETLRLSLHLHRRALSKSSFLQNVKKEPLAKSPRPDGPPVLKYGPSSRKPPSPNLPSSPPNPLRFRKTPLILAGLTAGAIACYSAYLIVFYRRAIQDGANAAVPADVSHRYDSIAPSFDASVDHQEMLMGLKKLRKRLAQQATGDVCEVSIGTGRNLTFYDWDFRGVNGVGKVGMGNKIKRGTVRSFTAVDKSAEMLEIAHEKFATEYPGIIGVRWVIQDAARPLPAPPVSSDERSGNLKGKKYDTIVQTMGLCSTPDPVGLLKNLGDSVEQDGRILLLEHGKGTWGWVNTVLDNLAPRHAMEFGCWWNKDIGLIVEESGLEVVKMERRHFGTTWWIELKPKRVEVREKKEVVPVRSADAEPSPVKAVEKKSSWWPF